MDEKSIDELLDSELRSELVKLDLLEDGSETKGSAVDNVAKLYHARLEKEKAKAEIEEKKDRLESEKLEAEFQHRATLKDGKMKIAFRAIELASAWFLFILGMNFEKSNTFCSQAFKDGRNWIQKKFNQK